MSAQKFFVHVDVRIVLSAMEVVLNVVEDHL